MARNPVNPVYPVDPVGPVRRVDSGSIYFRHLDEWRIRSNLQAAERRARLRWAGDSGFAEILAAQE